MHLQRPRENGSGDESSKEPSVSSTNFRGIIVEAFAHAVSFEPLRDSDDFELYITTYEDENHDAVTEESNNDESREADGSGQLVQQANSFRSSKNDPYDGDQEVSSQ